jgi:hypothetical protein
MDSDATEIIELPAPVQCSFATWSVYQGADTPQEKTQCPNQTRHAKQGTSDYERKCNKPKPLCKGHLLEDGLKNYYIIKRRLSDIVYPNRVWISLQYLDFERMFREAGLKGNTNKIHELWKTLNDLAVERAWATFYPRTVKDT